MLACWPLLSEPQSEQSYAEKQTRTNPLQGATLARIEGEQGTPPDRNAVEQLVGTIFFDGNYMQWESLPHPLLHHIPCRHFDSVL